MSHKDLLSQINLFAVKTAEKKPHITKVEYDSLVIGTKLKYDYNKRMNYP